MSLFLQKLVTLGQETINTQVYAQLDPNQCHVMTEHMQWYTLIGEAVPGGRPVKILRLAAFASNTPPSVEFSIRVYVVEDTHDALEVIYNINQSQKNSLFSISLGMVIQNMYQNFIFQEHKLSLRGPNVWTNLN